MKRRMTLLLGPLALLAAGSSTTYTGVVRDEASGDPLSGARVEIADHATSTDTPGFYSLEVDEDEEPLRVHVEAHGYSGYSDLVVFHGDRDQPVLDFDLKPLVQEEEQTPDVKVETAPPAVKVENKVEGGAAAGGKSEAKGGTSAAEGGEAPNEAGEKPTPEPEAQKSPRRQ